MQNEIVILKVSKFKTVALVGVTYRKADGTTGVSHGKTEAEAIANISKVVEVKQNDFAPTPKRSSSGSYFRNNNGVMVEVWKKSEKSLYRKEFLPYLNNMTNDFANISAESNLSDCIALRIEDFTGPIPESWGGERIELTEAEKAEANIWFDERRDSWMMDLVGTI